MSGLSSLSGAPMPGLGKMAPGVQQGEMTRSSSLGDLPDPLGGRKGAAGGGSMSHLDDLFGDEGPTKKDKGKKGKAKLSNKSDRQTKSFRAPKASVLLEDSTDEEMFPKSRGNLMARTTSMKEKTRDIPLGPPSSDSEDGDNTPAFSGLRARRGLNALEPTSKSLGAMPSAAPSPLDTGDRLMSFLQDDIGEVTGALDGDDDLDVFGTSSRQRTPPAGRGRRSAGNTPEQTPPTTPPPGSPNVSVDPSGDMGMRSPEPEKSPLGRRAPVSQAAADDDDFLDLDLPTAPPAVAVKHAAEEAGAKSVQTPPPAKPPSGPSKGLKQSDEWSLDLDILPEGEAGGSKTPEPVSPEVDTSRNTESSPDMGSYMPSFSGPKKVGRRAPTAAAAQPAAPSPRGVAPASHQPASVAARSRLAEEAKRQMALDLESSGDIELPSYGTGGPPAPISASAAATAAAASGRAAAGRRAPTSIHLGDSPSPPAPLSPMAASAAASRPFGSSGAEMAALADRHAKEIEALKAEHRETVEAFQAEVRRLATKLAEGGGDSKRTADAEARLAELEAKVASEREKHLAEIGKLRADSADNIRHLEKIQALQSEQESMQRTMESKDSQLRELDEVRGKLRDKEYELFQVGKELEQAKALHTASLDSATRKVAAEMEDVKREAEAAARRHRDELDKLRDDIRREAAQQVAEVEREMARLKGELQAHELRAQAEAAAAEARGRKEAEDERDKAIRELKARESALEEEREVVQRHAVSAQVLSDLSHKVDSVAANAVDREERIAKQIDRNLKERESTLSGREADLALREEAVTAREREAEALRKQMQTIVASLEKTAVQEREELLSDRSRLAREQSRLDSLTSTLQDERADLRMQVDTEKDSLTAAREARLADREALVKELCDERRRVAEERSAALVALDEARTAEHAARRRCFEYEARANAALDAAQAEEARAGAMREGLESERAALAAGREALEKEKAAIHEESSQLMALGLQVQGRSAELKRLKDEADYQMRLAEEGNAGLSAERAGIQAKEQRLVEEKRQLNEIRKGLENERLRIATERKALASDRVAASKATDAARDVQVKLSMMVRGWAAEGIQIPVDWEAVNFSLSALSTEALTSIKRRVRREPAFAAARPKANHRPSKAAGGEAVSNSVRKQMEFLEALRKQQAAAPPGAPPPSARGFGVSPPPATAVPPFPMAAFSPADYGAARWRGSSPLAPPAAKPQPAAQPGSTAAFSQAILQLSSSSSDADAGLRPAANRSGVHGLGGAAFMPPPGRLSNISEQVSPIAPSSSYTTATTPSSTAASDTRPGQRQPQQRRAQQQYRQESDTSATPSSSSAAEPPPPAPVLALEA
eukprot:jgi/Tetstr1/457339/TSEL_043942.t1